jgi:cytochrome b561
VTGPKLGIIAVSGGLVPENVPRPLFGAILLPDDLTTQSFSSNRDRGGEVMASRATQRIAAADSPHGSSVEHLPSVAKRTSFDGVTLTFHWATVVLVLALFTTAIWSLLSHDDMLRVLLLRVHRSLGVTVWTATLLRLLWRKTNAKLPPFPDDMTRLHRTLVQVSEYCLYALLVLQPTIGFGAMLTRGRSFTLFWGHVPPLIPHYPTVEAVLFSLHRAGAWALGLLITAHAVNALVHHFIIRDNTLTRMAPILRTERDIAELALERGDQQTSFGR